MFATFLKQQCCFFNSLCPSLTLGSLGSNSLIKLWAGNFIIYKCFSSLTLGILGSNWLIKLWAGNFIIYKMFFSPIFYSNSFTCRLFIFTNFVLHIRFYIENVVFWKKKLFEYFYFTFFVHYEDLLNLRHFFSFSSPFLAFCLSVCLLFTVFCMSFCQFFSFYHYFIVSESWGWF